MPPYRAEAMPSTRRGQLRLLYAATLAEFTAMGVFIAAIPLYVTDELGGTKAAAGLAVGSFSISAVLLRPAIGRGIDGRGRRPFLIGALVLLAASSPLFLIAHSVPAIIALRMVQGVVGAAFYTTAAAVTTDLSGPEQRASAIARFSLFLYGGFAIGPTLAESAISGAGFWLVWWIAVALAVAGLVAVVLLPETGGAAMAYRAELVESGQHVRRLIHRAAIAPGVVLAAAGVGYSSVVAFSPLYARHIGLSSSGGLYATFAVTIIGVRVASLRMLDSRGRVPIALSGLALGVVGLGSLALFQSPAAAYPGVAAFGAGFALIFPALMAFTVDRVPDHERGEALGSFTAFMDIGTGTGGYLVGTIADHLGFGWAYGVPALLCAGGLVLLATMTRRASASQAGAEAAAGAVGV
jgi:MFS family permease